MRCAFKPDGTEQARAREQKRAGGAAARGYWCAACNTRVAGEDAAIEAGGAHRHHFTNPAGIDFAIGCFREARVSCEGAPTLEATWFPGFAWSFAHCANCGEHLGWSYDGDGAARFYGLILTRLVGPI